MTEREFWNDAYRSDPVHTMVPDVVVSAETEHLEPGTALDLGCGRGDNALALAKRGWQVTGIDWSEHAVFLAERAAWREGVTARFEVADARNWMGQHRFDLVISTFALPAGGDGVTILRNAARHVAPGGTLVVAEWDRSMAAHWGFRPCDLHTAEAIAAVLKGFEVPRAETRRVTELFVAEDPRATHGLWADLAVVHARRLLSP